ncbi:MAG: glycosyltransferase family 1 protein [Acidobacteria bacterium]|nr:MAG: glycosyltransferase family 1 protein [Acidobacteriota bacterium]
MFNYEYPPLGGGGGVVHQYLADELSRRGNQVTVITSQFGRLPSIEMREKVKILRVPVLFRRNQSAASLISMLSYFPTSLKAGLGLLKNRPFDLVHSMFAVPSAPSGLLASRLFGLPHVVSILGGDVYDPSKRLSPHRIGPLRLVVRNILERSNRIIGMSSDIVQRARQYYNLSKPITVIPHAIKKPNFEAVTRTELGFSPDEVLLVTVGRLVPRKRIPDLLHALRKIGGKARLVIVGDGPERKNLEGLSSSLGVSEKVTFMGYVDERTKLRVLRVADIYVAAPQHEGFGLVFIEAMAAGLPVVTYNNGGQADFLEDGKTGYLIELGDTEMLAQRIDELCHSPEARRDMGGYNLQAVKQYLIENCADRYEALYESVVLQPTPVTSLPDVVPFPRSSEPSADAKPLLKSLNK